MKNAIACWLVMLLAISSLPASAGDKEALLQNVAKAYGGKALKRLNYFRVSDRYLGFRYGQSHSPDRVDAVPYRAETYVDLGNQNIDFRWVRGGKDNFSTQHQMFLDGVGYRIDHDEKTMSLSPGLSFASAERRHLYFLDTMLVLLMTGSNATITQLDDVPGHHVVTLEAKGYPEMTLWIDQTSYLIKRMQRPHWRPGVKFDYEYSGHRKKNRIAYATSFYVTRGGDPFYASVNRNVSWSLDYGEAFLLPKTYGEAPETLVFDEMQVSQIAKNTYLVGQHWGFSVFYNAGDYWIATGGYEELSKRFAALQSETNSDKPLKYQIVTHHHIDHLSGMKEAFDLGATFVTIAAHVQSIREIAGVNIPDDRFELVEQGRASLASGQVEILVHSNSHASHNLLSFFKSAHTVFTADLFLSRQAQGSPSGYDDLAPFKTALEDAGFDARFFAAAHSGRILTADDLNAAIANNPATVCPKGWSICP